MLLGIELTALHTLVMFNYRAINTQPSERALKRKEVTMRFSSLVETAYFSIYFRYESASLRKSCV